MQSLLIAVVLGVVEGLTEYLPVSSTGHLILTGHLLGLEGLKAAHFEIFIQLGAVLAVAWEYRATLAMSLRGLAAPGLEGGRSRRFAGGLLAAFLPAAVAGLVLHGWIEEHLFSPWAVAAGLIAGALAMLAMEWWLHGRPAPSRDDSRSLPLALAFGIGCAQVLSLYPGVSRSAATIMGGLAGGLSRRAATEFSFFLALPTLGAASFYSLYKASGMLSKSDATAFAVGLVVSFAVALVVIRVFLAWVRSHDFRPFAWYRIALGIAVLLILGRS